MGQNSKIEWCHHSVNLWHGCTKVHAGCDNCYAEKLSKRWGKDVWGNDKPRLYIKSAFNELDKIQKLASKANEVHRVFVGSMMDIFEKPMPLIDGKGEKVYANSANTWECNTGHIREELFMEINAGKYPNILFLFLTKRPSNINKYIPEFWKYAPMHNVMFGTSISDQDSADTLIPQLLKVKGKRFLSIEPQIEDIDICKYLNRTVHMPDDEGNIDWVIQGGESGHGKRPFDIDWAYKLRDQCKHAGVPYFFKQIDKIQPVPEDLNIMQFPK